MARENVFRIQVAAPPKLREAYQTYMDECLEKDEGFADLQEWFQQTFKVRPVRDNDGWLIGYKFQDEEELTAFLIGWCT